MKARRAGLTLAILLVLALTGCSGGTQINSDSVATIYVSLPLRGASGGDGRDIAGGARLALAQAGGRAEGLRIRAIYMDDTSGSGAGARWSAAQVGANARRATEDSTSIAYLGDFESGATRVSEPITNEAHLLQVSPASSAVDLTRPFAGSEQLPTYEEGAGDRTFGRVIPDDYEQGRALGRWIARLGYKRVEFLGSNGSFGRSVEDGFRSTAGRLISRSGPYDAVVNAGDSPSTPATPSSGSAGLRRPLFETDALLPPWGRGSLQARATSAALDPSQLPNRLFVNDFRHRYGRSPGRYAAYGYEAMSLVLDSISRAAGDTISRQDVVDAFFDTTDRSSILGTYSIDDVGNTTLDRFTGYRVAGNRLRPIADVRAR